MSVSDSGRSRAAGAAVTVPPIASARNGSRRRSPAGDPHGLADRIRLELRRSGRDPAPGGAVADGPTAAARADQGLAELIGDAVVLQEAAGRVERRALVPVTVSLLVEIRGVQSRLFSSARRHAERSGSREQIRLLVIEHLDHRVRFMRSCLYPGFTVTDGLDFIAMCLAESFGRWGVMARLAASDGALAELAEEAQALIRPQLSAVVEAAAGQSRPAA